MNDRVLIIALETHVIKSDFKCNRKNEISYNWRGVRKKIIGMNFNSVIVT